MKKKLAYLFSILFACVMFVGLFIFVMSGDRANQLNITGKWKIVGSFNQGVYEYHEDEYIVFDEEQAIYCKLDECYKDTYKLSAANEIAFLDYKYHVGYKIDEYLKFYMSDDTYLILLRWADENIITNKCDIEYEWNVVYKDIYVNDMKLEFKEGTLNQIMKDTTNSYSYEIEGNCILVDQGKLSFIYIPLNENEIVFIDTTYGTVWGLNR